MSAAFGVKYKNALFSPSELSISTDEVNDSEMAKVNGADSNEKTMK